MPELYRFLKKLWPIKAVIVFSKHGFLIEGNKKSDWQEQRERNKVEVISFLQLNSLVTFSSASRSLSFKGNIFSIGTGSGTVLFYDLRAGKALELSACTNRTVNFKTSTGWLVGRSDGYFSTRLSKIPSSIVGVKHVLPSRRKSKILSCSLHALLRQLWNTSLCRWRAFAVYHERKLHSFVSVTILACFSTYPSYRIQQCPNPKA